MKTAIMTDTNSGMTAAEAEQLGIFLLPMPVIVDGQSYLEGIDIRAEQLYDAMERGCAISTSQPTPGSILELWNTILASGYDEIVHIPMSSGLSGSCQSAALLAGDFGETVQVADNHRISVPQRESVLEAKHMADEGRSAKEIKQYLEATASRSSIYLTVASLKYLQMGGRLNQPAAMLGTLLNIKPILSIQGGTIDVVDKVRGMKPCEKKMIEALQTDHAERFGGFPASQLRIGTAGTLRSQGEIEQVVQTVQTAFPEQSVQYWPLPCSIACHAGPDCIGMGIWIAEH